MDENLTVTRFELEDLITQKLIIKKTDTEIILNPKCSRFGFPLDMLPQIYENYVDTSAIDAANEHFRNKLQSFLDIAHDDLYPSILVTLWMSFPRLLAVWSGMEYTELFAQTEEIFQVLSPMKKIPLSTSYRKTMDVLEKHITVWQNWDHVPIPQNAFHHLWDTYDIPHYHVCTSFQSALNLFLFNIGRTWKRHSGKRVTYAISTVNTNFTVSETIVLEKLNRLFTYPCPFPETMLLELTLNDVKELMDKATPLRYFAVTEEQVKEEENRGHKLKTNRIVYQPIFLEPQEEIISLTYDRIPTGEPIEPPHVTWGADRLVGIPDATMAYFADNFTHPPVVDKRPSLQPFIFSTLEEIYKEKLIKSKYVKLVIYLLANPTAVVDSKAQRENDDEPYIQLPSFPDTQIVSNRIVPEIDTIAIILELIFAVLTGGVFTDVIDFTVVKFPLLADILSRIKPFVVRFDDEGVYGRFHIVNTVLDEFPLQPGTCTINVCHVPPVRSLVPLSVITHAGPSGRGEIITAADAMMVENVISNVLKTKLVWTDAARSAMIGFMAGDIYDGPFPEIQYGGRSYQVIGDHDDRNRIIGMGASLGRGVARSRVLNGRRLVVASGIAEISRLALTKRIGTRAFGGSIGQFRPLGVYRVLLPKFSAPELVTYCQKMFAYEDSHTRTLADYGSGEYYNMWLTSKKIVQIDIKQLVNSPIGSVVNIQYDLSKGEVPRVDTQMGIAINSVFFRSKWEMDMYEFFTTFITNVMSQHEVFYFNIPYYAKDSPWMSGISERQVLNVNGVAMLRMGSYPPVHVYDEKIYDQLHNLDLTKYTVNEINIGYPALVMTQKVLPRSLTTRVLQEAKSLASFNKTFRIARI